ncbi:AAC(3) family N-acetyltransferase [bacterium]|nr:AAC(3) family N-acetyltransferase [bacterium]
MNAYSYTEIPEILNIQRGDLLLIGSDILKLALNVKEEGERFDPNCFIDSFLQRLGSEGTLLFPTFNFNFCKNIAYDFKNTSTAMGTLPKVCLQRKDFRRTWHPIHSFCVAGHLQDKICGLTHESSFGEGSTFEFLHENNGKMLIIGLPLQGAFTYVHYVEELEQVEYRYRKKFSAPYTDVFGKTTIPTVSMYVRDLKEGVISDLNPLEKLLFHEKKIEETHLKGVSFKLLKLNHCYSTIVSDIRFNSAASLFQKDQK